MLKPKQFKIIIIYVNVCVKRVYPHKANNDILFCYRKNSGKSNFRPMIEFAMIELASKSPAVINCTVKKSKQFAILKILIFTRTSMTRQHTLFSNESRFSLCFSDGRYCVYRSCGERFTDPVCARVRPFWRRKCYDVG